MDKLSSGTKETYNIHVASVSMKAEIKVLKCQAELVNVADDKDIKIKVR